MDLQQAKIILEKINRLYKSMTLDEKRIDVFEQDLMLSYIRQLYASFSEEEIAKVRRTRTSPLPDLSASVKKAPVAPEPKVVREETPVQPVVKVAEPKPKVEKTPEPKVIEKEEAPVVAKPVEAVVKKPKVADTSDYADLFEYKEAKELSEKLSERPIKDLSKAMGLNDKYLTLNDLFGGEQKVFDETLKALNGMSNYEEAKAYLAANIAGKYDWTNKSKKSKARVFVKLVRRRYK